LRDETEWVETVQVGANQLVGASTNAILAAFDLVSKKDRQLIQATPYGEGDAAEQIVAKLAEHSS
jgi:UDP-GlcNAc3NAcA epimerase